MSARPGTGRLVAWAAIVGILAALGYVGRFTGGKLPKEPLGSLHAVGWLEDQLSLGPVERDERHAIPLLISICEE